MQQPLMTDDVLRILYSYSRTFPVSSSRLFGRWNGNPVALLRMTLTRDDEDDTSTNTGSHGLICTPYIASVNYSVEPNMTGVRTVNYYHKQQA